MTDIQKELQKLRALINQKQTTAIFSNKSNESTKLSSGDTELFINDMSKRFSFTRAGVRDPVNIDPREKAINNLEYINGAKVSDITGSAFAIDELRDITSKHDERITNCETDIQTNVNRLDEQDGRIDECDSEINKLNNTTSTHNSLINSCINKNTEQDAEIQALDAKIDEIEAGMVGNIVDKLVEYDYRADPLSVTISNTNNRSENNVKYVDITFSPAITDANLLPGTHYFAKIKWSVGGEKSYGWNKYINEDGRFVTQWLGSGSLYNNTWSIRYIPDRDAPISYTYMYDGFCKNLTIFHKFQDERMDDAVINSVTDSLMTEQMMQKETGSSCTYTYSYNNSTGYITINFAHEYDPDNLKYGKDVTFVTAMIKQTVLFVMTIGVYWTYDKTPKSDGSYSIIWWLHDPGNGTSTTVNPTYSKGVWSCASGRSGSAYSLSSISVPGTIHVIREDVTIKSIRPSLFRTMIVDFIYPIGSVYVSFDKTSPAERFGVGTWLAITNRFLYCTTGSGIQGGSRYITEENLPEHKHGILSYYDDFNFNHGTDPTSSNKNSMPLDIGTSATSGKYVRTTYTESIGLETAYMPEYITVFAWRRTG